jgi:hypothetical protein
LVITDGAYNQFDSNSIRWEVYPSYASITPESCSRTDNVTRCSATLSWPYSEEYTVFASGHGVLGEPARQFRELKQLPYSCTYSTEDGYPAGTAYRVDCWGSLPDGKIFSTMRLEEEAGVHSNMWIYNNNTEYILESERQIFCEDDSTRDYVQGIEDLVCQVYIGEDIDGTGQFDVYLYSTNFWRTGQCPETDCGLYELTLDKKNYQQGTQEVTIIDSGCFNEYKKIIIDEDNYSCEYDQDKAAAIRARIQVHNEYLFNLVGEEIAKDVKNGEGSCHDWWDHYDENGVWQECGF